MKGSTYRAYHVTIYNHCYHVECYYIHKALYEPHYYMRKLYWGKSRVYGDMARGLIRGLA